MDWNVAAICSTNLHWLFAAIGVTVAVEARKSLGALMVVGGASVEVVAVTGSFATVEVTAVVVGTAVTFTGIGKGAVVTGSNATTLARNVVGVLFGGAGAAAVTTMAMTTALFMTATVVGGGDDGDATAVEDDTFTVVAFSNSTTETTVVGAVFADRSSLVVAGGHGTIGVNVIAADGLFVMSCL